MTGLDDSLQELRGVARNLMPETLAKYGLKSALEDYCSTLKKKDTKITLQFYEADAKGDTGKGNGGVDGGMEHLDTDKYDSNRLLMIYRIMQELINNAVKHSGAKEILVQYIDDGHKTDITVEDDGVGFHEEIQVDGRGMGIANIRNRVGFLDGKMDIRSAADEGTSVNIQIAQR